MPGPGDSLETRVLRDGITNCHATLFVPATTSLDKRSSTPAEEVSILPGEESSYLLAKAISFDAAVKDRDHGTRVYVSSSFYRPMGPAFEFVIVSIQSYRPPAAMVVAMFDYLVRGRVLGRNNATNNYQTLPVRHSEPRT